ncbi:MAG: MFS transporter [Nitrososphaerales archaeon]
MQYKWVALSVTTVGTLMSGIDVKMVVIGLPTIARQLGADAEAVIWVYQAYVFASTIGLLLVGRMSDLFGRVKMYNLGFVIFTIGSALGSISLTAPELIAARIVQGTGASLILANSAAILTDAAPSNELGFILGTNQIAFRAGSIFGLTLAGIIITIADWRALFYINIPIGIFGAIWAYKMLKETADRDTARKIDWLGFVTFTAGLTLILLSVTYLSYNESLIFECLLMAVAGAVLFGIFAKLESRTESPLLDLKLLSIKEFAGGSLARMLNALAWEGTIVILVFYLQTVEHESPLTAGLALVPIEVSYLIVGPISGRLSDRYSPRLFVSIGLVVSSAGFFLLSFPESMSSFWIFMLVSLLMGVGNGLFVSPNLSAVMGSVPQNRRGIASGFQRTLFNIGLTAGPGVAVLLITLGIPYGTFSAFIQGTAPNVALATSQFINGTKIAVIVLATINAIALVPSLLGSKRTVEIVEV